VHGRAKEISIKLDSKFADLPIIQADPEGLHRAILNIVSNALDAVEERENGQVAVGTKLEADGEMVLLVVVDNGVGISPERLNDIFKPFVSSKGSKGTGLGLAVSRKILREHGGDIVVQSQPGKGTKFILRLPVRSPLSADAGGTSNQMPTVRPPEPD